MTRIANMLRMKLTQLCVSINTAYFQKKRAFCSCPNFTLSFYSEEWDSIKSFKPIVNIYRNIQKTYSKHGFNKFLLISNYSTVSSLLALETLFKIIGLANNMFCQFIVMSKKHYGPSIKFNYGQNEEYFHFCLWKLFISNNRIVRNLSNMKSQCSNSTFEYKKVKHELRIANHGFSRKSEVTSSNPRVTSSNLQVTS